MEQVRAFFSDALGVEATGFTVFVGTDHESSHAAYFDLTGNSILGAYRPNDFWYHGWVTSTDTGGAVIGLMYGGSVSARRLDSLVGIVAHEYFHVLIRKRQELRKTQVLMGGRIGSIQARSDCSTVACFPQQPAGQVKTAGNGSAALPSKHTQSG